MPHVATYLIICVEDGGGFPHRSEIGRTTGTSFTVDMSPVAKVGCQPDPRFLKRGFQVVAEFTDGTYSTYSLKECFDFGW